MRTATPLIGAVPMDRSDAEARAPGIIVGVADVWRPSLALRTVAVLVAVGSLVFSIWIVAVAASEGVWWQGVAFAAGLILLPAATGLRYALRTRIEVRPDALVVVTTLSERRFQWADIQDAAPGYAGITLLLKDGSTFVAGAVQKANAAVWLKRRSRADELVAIILDKAKAA